MDHVELQNRKSRKHPNNPNFFKDLRRHLWNIMDWGSGSHKKRVFETLRCPMYYFDFIYNTPDYKNSNITRKIIRFEILVLFQIQDYGDLTA